MTRLRGKNVLLRSIRSADVLRQREFFRDEELARLDSSSLRAYEEIDVEALLMTPGADTLRLGIEVDGAYIGFCSLMNTSDPSGVLELGIMIGDRRYWDRGFGREVVRLLMRHGFLELSARTIELTTNAGNPRALRCFSACGFEESNRVPGRIAFGGQYVDMVEMSIDADRWRGAERA